MHRQKCRYLNCVQAATMNKATTDLDSEGAEELDEDRQTEMAIGNHSWKNVNTSRTQSWNFRDALCL